MNSHEKAIASLKKSIDDYGNSAEVTALKGV